MVWWIIGILFVILFILFARYVQLGNKGSLIGVIFRKVIGMGTYLVRDHQLELLNEYKKLNNATEWKIMEGKFRWFSVKKVDINGLAASLLTPKNPTDGKIILQLHGGGYEIDLPNNSLYFATKFAKLLKTVEVLTINYRVAPENPFPAALEDAVKAYKWLLDNGYNSKKIIIAGDSAGGGLALATVMYLRDNNISLPLAIITMSAWTDLTNTEESFTKNFKIDPVFGNSTKSIICTSRYAEGMDKKNPYISPMYGNYKRFPDILMQVGTHEMLLSDTTQVAKKARADGVCVYETVYKGMFHIFQKFSWILPECVKAWKEVKEFMEREYNINKK